MNKRKMFLWMLPWLAFTAVVFAGNGGTRTGEIPAPQSLLPGSRPIVRILSRGHAIIVTSTSRGPAYSATSSAGNVLATNLSLDELRLTQPALYREIGPTLSASQDPDALIGAIDLAE